MVSVPNASKTTLAWSWDAFHNPDLWVALITFLYLDFLDATGEHIDIEIHNSASVADECVADS